MNSNEKLVLITGSARRIGKALAIGAAQAGWTVIIHHGHSPDEAIRTREEINALGGSAYHLQADLADQSQVTSLIKRANEFGQLYGLVNNAAIFEPLTWHTTSLESWNRHIQINLTAPFQLSQEFARQIQPGAEGRIINILDWRALRPGDDHLPYTISKVALAGLTKSLAVALAPHILVNALALGAVLPPANDTVPPDFLHQIPVSRWAELDEVVQAMVFLLHGPGYITGEIIHVDGGRHLI
jgi:NAD(P)-dependent dehydrogenase (short-subunit alcohol dehydrogenase family)